MFYLLSIVEKSVAMEDNILFFAHPAIEFVTEQSGIRGALRKKDTRSQIQSTFLQLWHWEKMDR